jgi:primosomal replication protein N
MASLNNVVLLGNLTRDPEVRYTPSGTPVATLGLAVNNRIKQGDEWKDDPCFIDVVVFGKQAESCGEYLSKGSRYSLRDGSAIAPGRGRTVRSAVSTKCRHFESNSCPKGVVPQGVGGSRER